MSDIQLETLRTLAVGKRFLVFLFAVLPGNHTVACVGDYVRAATGRPANLPVLRALVDALVEASILEEGVVARGVPGPAYRLKGSFSAKALQMLAADAAKHGWWPTPKVAESGLAGAWLGDELAFGVRNFVEPMQVWQVAETLRAVLIGGECAAFGVPPGARYPLASVHWTAVGRLLALMGPSAVLPTDNLTPRALDALLPTMLELGFLHGAEVRPLLEAARALVATPGVRPPASFLCACCALGVWLGRRDLLDGFAGFVPRSSPAERFAALCGDVFEGRFVEAEKAFAACADDVRGALPTDVSTPVWLLGAALALRVGAPLARTAKYAAELKREPETLNWHPVGRQALHTALGLRAALVGRLMDAKAGTAHPYLDAAPFVKRAAPEPKWKTALHALEACLPKKGAAAKAEQTLNGSIGWNLTLIDVPRDDAALCACLRLTPVYRGPRGAEDGRDDHVLTLRALASAKYRACLAACDAEVLQVLLKTGYDPRAAGGVPDDALELLCGHPRLMACTPSADARVPMTLERRLCEVTTARGENGEMVLSLPDWLFAVSQMTYILRRAEAGTYLFHPLPKRVRDVVSVFAAQDEGRRLVVPHEALGEARDILERLAGVMSVGGAFAVGVGGGFARVEGDPTPHVRLVYAHDALSLALVVEPLANRAVAACEPGMGLAERLVQLRGGRTVLLVRNLAAETRAAEPVRAALEPFEAWATGKSRWLVADAEAALDALRALHALADVRLDWPEGEKTRVAAPSAGGVRIEASGTDWFALDGTVTLDDGRVIALMDLLRALENREGNYVRFGERDFLYLSGELLRRMEALATVVTSYGGAEGKTVRNQIAPAALPMLARVFEDGAEGMPALPKALAARAETIRTAFAEKVETPRLFKGTLRPYQETGYAWLEHLAACGFGACLADDMGLGKTVQIVALLLGRAAAGVSLVVAPASVCVNWVREFERFAPTLRPVTLWGEKALPAGLGAGDVVVASYGLMVARAEDFASVDWNGIVLDEAQAVKNAATQRAHAAGRLRAKFRVAATGTPVENRLAEFWSIFSFLNPGLLGTQREFESRFSEAGFATRALKRIVEPFVLRRLKRDVLKELPEKTEITLRVKLGETERAAYEACRRQALEGLKTRGETENRVSILAALTRLRRFCCHPSLVLPELVESAKLAAVLDLLEDLHAGGHRALVFSQFVDYLAIVREAVAARGWTFRYLDGSTAPAERIAAVDAFQRGDGDFFLISLKAGGTGLNLTAANYVLLLDPWWNPAVEDQAADRAHRIGQKLPVTVYRIVAEGTVEDRILDLHGDKRAVSEDLLASARGTALTPERLMTLFDATPVSAGDGLNPKDERKS